MPTVSVHASKAQQNVTMATDQRTQVEVRGSSIEILIGGAYDTLNFGHAALRVITKDGDYVYDYGLYGYKDFPGVTGEGVLNIWNDFSEYITRQNSLGRVTTGFVFEISDKDAQAINEFYKEIIANTGTKKPKNPDENKGKKQFRIEDYYPLGPNCVTITMKAVKIVFPNIDREWLAYRTGRGLGPVPKNLADEEGWPNYIFMPADFQALLEGSPPATPKSIKTYRGKS